MKTPSFAFSVVILASLVVSGCGTYVPEIQEPNQNSKDSQNFVHAVVTNINCEIQDAFYALHQRYPKTFLDDWGVQTTIGLTLDEKGSFSPSALGMPPSPASAIFTVAGGINASSEAIRIDKLNYYNLIKTFNNQQCPAEIRGGPFILQNDLKLREWLFDAVQESGSGNVDFTSINDKGPLKENVISHEIKFEIISSGTVTPAWKLVRATVNGSGSLLTASRDRIQDLIITIGPVDSTFIKVKGKKGKYQDVLVNVSPSQQAFQIHYSNLIGSAVASGIRSAFTP